MMAQTLKYALPGSKQGFATAFATAFFTLSLTSRKPPLVFLLRGRETKLSSCCSAECRGSPLQLSYFLAEVIQFFDACQLSRPRGAGAVLRRDTETDVRRGGEKGRWTVVVRAEREQRWQEWQQWVGQERNRCEKEGTRQKILKEGKGTKRRARAEGTRMVHGGREELPADTSNKTKDTGRKHKHLAQLEREQDFQTIYGWQEMHTDKRIQKNLTAQRNLTYESALNTSSLLMN